MPSSIDNLGGWQTCLAKEKKVPDFCLNKAYETSINPELHNNILFYLHHKKTPHERGKTFEVKQVREVAEHILSGFNFRYKSSQPTASSKSTMLAPLVKTEISEVLNAITMMGQNLQMAMMAQMTSCPGPQTFQNAHQLCKPTIRGRTDPSQEQQALGVICAMKWLISSAVVPSWLSTLSLEKSLGICRPFSYLAMVTPFPTT